jgi:hypothetical protein
MIRSTASLFSLSSSAAVVALLAAPVPALANFVVPDGINYNWTRGSTPNSAFAQWEVFTSTAGPNSPDVGSFTGGTFAGGAPAWNTFDRNPFSFVTGGGNIYSFGGVVAPQVDIPNFGLGAGYVTTVLLQVRTQGTEVDPASVLIGGVAPVQTTELFRQTLGGFGGSLVDTLYRFEIPGNAAGYTLQFQASGSSMSLDRVAVDTFTVVPAPGAAVLLGVGGVLVGRRRRV